MFGAEELDVGFKGFEVETRREAVGKEFSPSLEGRHCGRFRQGAQNLSRSFGRLALSDMRSEIKLKISEVMGTCSNCGGRVFECLGS